VATHTAPILERILEFRRAAVDELKQGQTEAALTTAIPTAPAPRDFAGALHRRTVAVIAECKERSPSGGLLQVPYEPVSLARRYAANGAVAISVLTEPEFFGGSMLHLKEIRERVDVPVLCKDFIIDPIQVKAARAAGADAVLLIVAILDDPALATLYDLTRGLGMQALVEVHDEDELRRALPLDGTVIGINNRDLTRMTTDKVTTALLRPLVPEGRTVVSESGISGREDIEEFERMKVDAVLVGEALLRAPNMEAKLRELCGR
jgi:indole-3-glycerol phosphate synthase